MGSFIGGLQTLDVVLKDVTGEAEDGIIQDMIERQTDMAELAVEMRGEAMKERREMPC